MNRKAWDEKRKWTDAPDWVDPGSWAAGWNAAVAECERQQSEALAKEQGRNESQTEKS